MSFEIPEQSVWLYDPATDLAYYFDGVIKVQHSISVKIEDDPANIKKAEKYTNNATNEPDEVQIEIVMSGVYTTAGALSGDSGDRIRNAFSVLDALKRACTLLQVITPLKTYTDMLIKSLAVQQADGAVDSWSGTITLHERIEEAKKKKDQPRTGSAEDDGTSKNNTASSIDIMALRTKKGFSFLDILAGKSSE